MSLNNSELRNFKLPPKEKINRAIATFSKKERVIFAVLVLVLFVSSLTLLQILNRSLMVKVPLEGGTIAEGIIGTPRFVNPVLASSPADLDMVTLVYSGLMRKNGNGDLVADLASQYEMSKDGLTYTFILKDNIFFHNGAPVTVDDVIFTVDRVKNSVIKSPQKVNWDGVTVTRKNDKTLEFGLREPNANFLSNATLGIMPKALWKNDSMELNAANTMPVGSGPYKIENSSKEESGVINFYKLSAFDKFALGEPYVDEIDLFFYSNEEDMVNALRSGKIRQISSISPAVATALFEEGYRIESQPLPRVFGLFFNQNQNQLFTDKSVTAAINNAIDKERIVREVLHNYGMVMNSPIPENLMPDREEISSAQKTSREETLGKVKAALEKDGWSLGSEGYMEKTITGKNKKKTTTVLEFSIATGNAPELIATAELIRQDLALVGMKVDVKTFESGNLNQNVIRPRQYDALLFGEVINRESDLFAFWHSSQRKDPGLNVAMYTNARADKLLEDAFVTIDEKSREEKYAQFAAEIRKDIPAAFLYSPDFIYAISPDMQGLSLEHIVSPSDRLNNIYSLFTKTENVWKIFAKN